ncbi:MAG: hypothetical protein WCJ33_07725, partial [Pseudomonadota bacterium]
MAEVTAVTAETGASEFLENLAENMGEDALSDLTSAQTALANAKAAGIKENIAKAQENLTAAQERVLSALQNALKLKVQITEELLNKSGDPNPQQVAALELLQRKFIDPALKILKETIKNTQKANDETGDLNNSPKTKTALLEKYGPTGLKLLLAIAAIGFGVYELHKIASQMSGCYRFSTNTPGTPEKIGCSEDTCSCQNIAQCGPNNTPCTQANGVQYMWQEFSSIDALCQLPKMALDPISSGLSDLLKPLKEIVGGVLVVAVILFILYV